MSDGWVSPSGGPNHTGEQPAYGTQAPPPQQTGQRPPPQYGAYGPVPPAGPPQGPPTKGGQPQYTAPPFRPMAPKPGVVPLRPLTLGDIFGGAFATIRGNPAATLGLALIVHLIVAVPTLAVTLFLKRVVFPNGLDLSSKSDTGGSNPDLLKVDLIAPAAQIFTYIGGIVLAGMLIVVVSDAVLGRRISMRETWTRIRPRLWPLLGLTVLLAALALLAVAVVVGIVVVAALTAGTVLAVVLGVLLGLGLLVGVFFLSIRLMLASPALVLEGIGPVPAIKRSWALTHHAFWRLLGISFLATLVAGTVSAVVGVPGSLLNLGGYATDGTGSVLLLVGGQLWTAVVSAAVAPFVTGTTGLLYIDQRMRKEGLDVTLMSAAASRDDAPR
ncbi:glycerophosphoryl diester phosphodiesterase membrane domain-containing protein [Allobranchiibius sp. CTAmp26]|uniref:glycerophosphoryl diester phosphodiesterase membrane domain-containing protein n=1 Tax=Allobranchiibius sp. CTAmp26 TaxID=2815214 RepID=UPI001AA15038|nr:glycerophosphoryl diester phosphodiesterase membrane domain-containing protein [Allobranchiibius sp. CTAmp26]MBO1755809.1 glycerophosphoryl diester phosphodiesterase membrane domain-containing protein [Allobranchiibius sp. CTAmp26]